MLEVEMLPLSKHPDDQLYGNVTVAEAKSAYVPQMSTYFKTMLHDMHNAPSKPVLFAVIRTNTATVPFSRDFSSFARSIVVVLLEVLRDC